MSSATNSRRGITAAWRISGWSTLIFAVGAIVAFFFLHRFVSHEIQRRSDAWLLGEVEVLGDVAERTPKGILYDRIVDEIAELATKEVPTESQNTQNPNDAVFFLELGPDNSLKLWVGKGNSSDYLTPIRAAAIRPGIPGNISVVGAPIPFRIVADKTEAGDTIYLGLSEHNNRLLLRRMRVYFFSSGATIVLLGFILVFVTSRRTLARVEAVTDIAARIGQNDLKSRVPEVDGNDEIARLARTVNGMLDRIEKSVNQLHTITDSLAHDLRSPMTAIRGKLEMVLLADTNGQWSDPLGSAVEEIDRLTELLTKSLDVAEANADALRLRRQHLDLNALLRTIVDLYEPSLTDRGIRVDLYSTGPATIFADSALMHRMLANLLDNAGKHLPAGSKVTFRLSSSAGQILLIVDDDGPGFPPETLSHLFERFVKGPHSKGTGLGLAFVEAVVRAHDGQITAANRTPQGASFTITLPASSV